MGEARSADLLADHDAVANFRCDTRGKIKVGDIDRMANATRARILVASFVSTSLRRRRDGSAATHRGDCKSLGFIPDARLNGL
jgi:hypothetical protein